MVDRVKARLYDSQNDIVRIDHVEEADDHLDAAMMLFFRRLGIPHVYPERVAPALKSDGCSVFIAVRDREWPPWGLGSRTIAALCQIHPVGTGSYGLSPLFVRDEDATNLGLMAALYSEVLDHVAREDGAEVSYLVLEGSVLADRLLRSHGFDASDDLVVADGRRYQFYRAPAEKLRSRVGLDTTSVPELLAHELDDDALARNALYFGGLQLVTQPARPFDRTIREIAWIDGGLFDASLPGGVPPTPPTALVFDRPGDIVDPGHP